MNNFRVGFGFDVHRFTKGKKGLILGGVTVPYPLSFEAVSDGDLVLHAICDAICGAAGLGDIGDYFPPEDKTLQGISSKKIVEAILEKVGTHYTIVNIDLTIVADKPPLAGYKQEIVASLREVFNVPDINLKIKSKENLNVLGGSEAVACMATALLEKSS